ncbi:MAG: ribosome maturation factor RimP [Gammaproteobacteria bacterium]|nr:ribosome maturation factor RimP [Gammaproteobacteria bacterium]
MRGATNDLQQLLEPVVGTMGYELLGVEVHPHGGGTLLRLYIDQTTGITLRDCQRVSEQVSGVLDVEEPIVGHYVLEVSSPGVDRPLFNAPQFARHAGSRVRIQVEAALDGRRKFTGRLLGMRDDQVVIEEDGNEIGIPLEQIEKARLVPER